MKVIYSSRNNRLLTKGSLIHIWNNSIRPAIGGVVKVVLRQIFKSNHVTLEEIAQLLEICCKKV